jgi:hypothetical protein
VCGYDEAFFYLYGGDDGAVLYLYDSHKAFLYNPDAALKGYKYQLLYVYFFYKSFIVI